MHGIFSDYKHFKRVLHYDLCIKVTYVNALHERGIIIVYCILLLLRENTFFVETKHIDSESDLIQEYARMCG